MYQVYKMELAISGNTVMWKTQYYFTDEWKCIQAYLYYIQLLDSQCMVHLQHNPVKQSAIQCFCHCISRGYGLKKVGYTSVVFFQHCWPLGYEYLCIIVCLFLFTSSFFPTLEIRIFSQLKKPNNRLSRLKLLMQQALWNDLKTSTRYNF